MLLGGGPVDNEAEATAVVDWDACCGCVGEPLLRHDLTFGSDGLSCHADPSALEVKGWTSKMILVRQRNL